MTKLRYGKAGDSPLVHIIENGQKASLCGIKPKGTGDSWFRQGRWQIVPAEYSDRKWCDECQAKLSESMLEASK